jgi:hypothetical protein
MKVTISGVAGTNTSIVNSTDFFVELASNFPTSGNVNLFTDVSLSVPAAGTNLVATANTGVATTSLAGGGTATAGGSNSTVQFNSGALLGGDADFTYNNIGTKTLTVVGNITTTSINASNTITASRLISNIATGTAPISVTSTTKIDNLNADLLDGYDTSTSNTANTISVRDSNGSLTANIFIGNGSSLSSLAGSNVTGTVANANYSVSAGSATTAGTVTTNAQPNINSVGTLANLSVTGNISSGNANLGNLVIASYFSGDGSLLTGIPSGTTAVTVTGNAQPNITSVGTLTTLTVSGNANLGNVITTIITTGANTIAGTITGNWTLTAGSLLEATYADLAEYYESDKVYEPGTVVEFGGEKEVTLAEDGTSRVAGVVSTNPAYAMNANCKGITAAIALQGRVPTKVRGTIRKGDMMISGGNGFARPSSAPQMGTVIGKALENFDGVEGVIEVVVGRL